MSIQNFLNTLPIMLYGMLGIFAVIIVIFLLILILNRVTGKKTEKTE